MKIQIHLFGASTPSGESFRLQAPNLIPGCDLFSYSRSPTSRPDLPGNIFCADFSKPHTFFPAGEPECFSIWVSFAPIWLLAPFLEQLALNYPKRLRGLCGLIACSSSSVITKRFAFNRFDRDLVSRLSSAEDKLLANCARLRIPCRILQPTLIYGQVGRYKDQNLSLIIKFLRRIPVLLVPSHSGLRQPIHSSQLASAVLYLTRQIVCGCFDQSLLQCIPLGGDSTVNYIDMIMAMQKSLPLNDSARNCLLLRIPNRLYFLVAAPLLIRSPKTYEAILRIGVNLSGFTPVHRLLGCEPQPFPVSPLT